MPTAIVPYFEKLYLAPDWNGSGSWDLAGIKEMQITNPPKGHKLN